MGFLTAVENTMKSMATGTKNSVEALAERGSKVAGAIDDHFARYANDPTPYSGYMADQAAGLSAIAKHAVGGGLIGGALNAVAYENGASWTGAESVGSAFMGGAGYGAAAGGLLGMTRFGIYSKANQMNRISAHNGITAANNPGKTGFWSGLKDRMGFGPLPPDPVEVEAARIAQLQKARSKNRPGDVLGKTRSNKNTMAAMNMVGPSGKLP